MAGNKDLKGVTASLFEILEGREKELKKWEEDLHRRESLLQTATNGAKPDDILSLNVGGRTGIAVHRKTLTLLDNSVLGAKFSKNWEEGIDKDADGNIFIDQDPDLFLTLLNFLRAKSNDVRHRGVTCPRPSSDFDLLLDYYDIKLDVYPMEIKQVDGSATNVTISNYPPYSIASTDCCTFDLTSPGHRRLIRSFKIYVGGFVKLNVGWRMTSTDCTNAKVGEFSQSIAISVDALQQREILLNGANRSGTSLDKVTQGSTIVFESDASAQNASAMFRYSILNDEDEAGTPMLHSLYHPDASLSSLSFRPGNSDVVPCISLQGEIQVLDIDY